MDLKGPGNSGSSPDNQLMCVMLVKTPRQTRQSSSQGTYGEYIRNSENGSSKTIHIYMELWCTMWVLNQTRSIVTWYLPNIQSFPSYSHPHLLDGQGEDNLGQATAHLLGWHGSENPVYDVSPSNIPSRP